MIRRAIELQDDEASATEYGSLSADMLAKVAGELGIPQHHLDRAMAEQRAGLLESAPPAGLFDRILGLSDLEEAVVVEGTRPEVEHAVTGWFSAHEGLRVRKRTADGAVWEKDARPLASIRMGLGLTEGTKVLRDAGSVEHKVKTIDEDEHLVSVAVDPGRLRTTGEVLLAVVAALSVFGAIGVAAGTGSVLGSLATAFWTAAVFGTATILGIRAWSRRVSNALERALYAVRDPQSAGVYEPVPGWLGSVLRGIGLIPRRWRS